MSDRPETTDEDPGYTTWCSGYDEGLRHGRKDGYDRIAELEHAGEGGSAP